MALLRGSRQAIVPTRIGSAALSLCLAGLLVTAALLTPDERGHGTHEQLGLGPCAFATLVGWRCPTCGMTTAWSYLLHGKGRQALATQASGTLLALMALGACGWLAAHAVVGPTVRLPTARQLTWLAVALIGLVAIEWIIRLAAQGWGLPGGE